VPLAADFTGDGVADVLLPFERGGLLYAGKAGGGFEDPRPCGVDSAGGGGAAEAGDFDADGWLDVLAAGAGGPRVFQNRRDGTFEEVKDLSGEVSYKGQPLASSCGVGDFNNDSRLDVLLTYGRDVPLLYFNRGFRSFAQAPKLELALGAAIGGLDGGQSAGLLADLDHDGAEDLVLALPNGEVYCAFNDLGGDDAMVIQAHLPPSQAAGGPVLVTAYAGQRCLGARCVRAGGKPATFGIAAKGAYTLKWRLPFERGPQGQGPGGPEQVRRIPVVGKPVRVPLVPAGSTDGPTTKETR
jgi:hypothetical protein